MMFSPGNLVKARGRDWVVLPGSTEEVLRLRPVLGSDDEGISLVTSLEEGDEVRASLFPEPDPEKSGTLEEGSIFRTASILRLRNASGPLRSLGNIALEPRSYQLVPLMMAMKMGTVRLLIADDVGVGKTIEAGLIARELLDRYEIERLSVLCPSHLVSQWESELRKRFNLPAVSVTPSSVHSLEKRLPAGTALTRHYPVTVISLDYIKSDTRRDSFLHTAPELVIVDEAHSCTEKKGSGAQKRFELLERLSENSSRHMIFLTATPHSGDDIAFGNLLSLIDPRFKALSGGVEDEGLRRELSRHFVQRQRMDIRKNYKDNFSFAERLSKEYSYTLDAEWLSFFNDVRDYLRQLGRGRGEDDVIWYSIISLYRCVSSSPASALHALSARGCDGEIAGDLSDVLDKDNGEGPGDSLPSLSLFSSKALKALVEKAKELVNKRDPKFECLLSILRNDILPPDENMKDGARPIIFCKYINTAEYVGERLKKELKGQKDIDVMVITGRLTPSEREMRIASIDSDRTTVLVATDCLSEGINLQERFNAVIHYDLAWNPARHEQREGRIDRFGQSSPFVKCVLMYGSDNPVDGFILRVIIEKSQKIRKRLGVMVPVPEDEGKVRNAILRSALFKREERQLDFLSDIDADDWDKPWEEAGRKAQLNKTVFAQRSIHPETASELLKKEKALLGTDEDTERFVVSMLHESGAGVSRDKEAHCCSVNLQTMLEVALKRDLEDQGLLSLKRLSFRFPAPMGYEYIHRSHPLVSLLSSFSFEHVLSDGSHRGYGARSSAVVTESVEELTYAYLVRIRMTVISDVSGIKDLMAEEVQIIKEEQGKLGFVSDSDARRLLSAKASANLFDSARKDIIEKALQAYSERKKEMEVLAKARANELKRETRSLRDASLSKGNVSVSLSGPMDLLGVYVLIPEEDF